MNYKEMIKMALITAAAMFLSNYLAAMNPTARRWLKGTPVVGVSPVKANSV